MSAERQSKKKRVQACYDPSGHQPPITDHGSMITDHDPHNPHNPRYLII